MSALATRIGLLRKQAGLSAPPKVGAVPVRPATASIAELRRLLDFRGRALAVRPAPLIASTDRALPGEEIAPGLRYIEVRAAWPDVPARVELPGKLPDTVESRRVLAFDTETTGLAGGTGTRAFMVGVADWIDGHVRVRQLLISTLAAESSMLRTFAGWLAPDTVLLSYNGKSYDAPLLRTRYRLARLPEPLTGLGHCDLLHPTRRRYRGVWENCRLGTIERQLLGIVREDDLPGAQAPAAWLDYLRGGNAINLRRVAAHNLQDVRTLLQLLLRLSQA